MMLPRPSTLSAIDEKILARFLKAVRRAASAPKRGEDGRAVVEVAAGHVVRRLIFPKTVVEEALKRKLVGLNHGLLVLRKGNAAAHASKKAEDAPLLARHKPLRRIHVRLGEGGTETWAQAWINDAESPLAWLRQRRGRNGKSLISATAFAAGERLRRDFTRGQMTPRITANWQATVSSKRRGPGGLTYSDAVIDARQKVQAAMAFVGPELCGVLLDVCCFLKGLESVERERGWPARSGKVVLLLGLDKLARHYGLSGEARGPVRGRTRRWGAPDYRPSLDKARAPEIASSD